MCGQIRPIEHLIPKTTPEQGHSHVFVRFLATKCHSVRCSHSTGIFAEMDSQGDLGVTWRKQIWAEIYLSGMFSRVLALLVALAGLAVGADVVVYGGSSAGVMAAIAARQSGRTVVLAAPERHLGGFAVEGLGSSDINNHWFRNDEAVGGLAREFYRRVGLEYGANGPAYKFESKVAERVFESMVREAGVEVRRGERLKGVERRGARVVAVVMESGMRIEGAVFVDATIEGDLVAAAGIETTVGREANAKYGETKNGIRGENAYRQFAVRVDPYRVAGDAKSGLIPTIQDEPLGRPGDGDKRIQAFCFRLCLTKSAANLLPIGKPADYDAGLYEIYRRYAKAGGELWKPGANLPNGKTDLGSWHDLSANLYGMNHGWPEADRAGREQIYRQHLSFTHGLLWFMANDPELPEKVRAEWGQWGLCKDEFTDNGGWPRQLYVRDGRRMVSDLVLTEAHTRKVNAVIEPDPVAVAFWPPDTHHVRRIVRDRAAYNEGFVFGGEDWGPFGVSWRALLPRRKEAVNVLTPTAVSSSHVAYGAIRIELTFMGLGEAAGVGAAMAAEGGVAVQDVPYLELRSRLEKRGAVVSIQLAPRKD